jgi:hypothetical protein
MGVSGWRRVVAAVAITLAWPAGALADTEPNDSSAQAEVVTATPFTTIGSLGTDSDVDVYALYVATPGTQIRAAVDLALASRCSRATCGVIVIIAAATDESMLGDDHASGADSDVPSSAARLHVEASLSAKQRGTYYVTVRGGSNAGLAGGARDPYTLTIDANQPLLSYKPEPCDAARVELASRRGDLRKALARQRTARRKLSQSHGRARRAAQRTYDQATKLVTFQHGRVNAQQTTARAACGGSL